MERNNIIYELIKEEFIDTYDKGYIKYTTEYPKDMIVHTNVYIIFKTKDDYYKFKILS